MMQSIFSLAARRYTPRGAVNADRRDGELKMDWTKPLPDWSAMGIEEFAVLGSKTRSGTLALKRQGWDCSKA